EVLDVRREVAVREFAFAVAKAGEVEAQHRDAALGQRPADARGGEPVLGAREAMSKDRIGDGRAHWVIEARGEEAALRPWEADLLGGRHSSPSVSRSAGLCVCMSRITGGTADRSRGAAARNARASRLARSISSRACEKSAGVTSSGHGGGSTTSRARSRNARISMMSRCWMR